jgi:hypothetical protein
MGVSSQAVKFPNLDFNQGLKFGNAAFGVKDNSLSIEAQGPSLLLKPAVLKLGRQVSKIGRRL